MPAAHATSDAVPDIQATGRLLDEVFPGSKVGSADYLSWLYVDNPVGPVIQANLDDKAGRAGHYAVVPFALAPGASGPPLHAALSLNTAVHERARGGGVFVSLAEETYAQAAEAGIAAVVGVANANSTPGFVRRLGFSLLASLPARVLAPTPGRREGVESVDADAAVRSDDRFWERLEPFLEPAPGGLSPAWDRASLAWRLSSPRGPYAVHLGPGGAAISTAARPGGVRVAVVLKLLPAGQGSPTAVRALIRAACRRHRAPAAVWAGLSDAPIPAGIALPARLKPSPLNLIFRRLGGAGVRTPRFGSFEFLDFDAY